MAKKLSDADRVIADASANGMRRALVITALPLELAAVRAELKHLGSELTNDGTFELEQFSGTGSEWLVVCGESGAGNLQAMSIVTTAVQKFGPFELIVFVGVAATRKPDDAPIGSVMAAKFVYMAEVGKYDAKGFHSRARMLKCDRRLVGIAQKLARDGTWKARLKDNYAGRKPGDIEYPEPYPPEAFVCPIVSTESVSAHLESELERHINDTYQDATGLEMEGYGTLMAAEREELPCIIVRGVSDARQGKDPVKDKFHQPIAAGHAVAFALELIDTWGVNFEQPTQSSPTTPPGETATVVASPATKERASIVVHLRGEASDYTEERRDEILAAVRASTGDDAAEITGFETGSYHLFVDVSASAWKSLGATGLSKKLVEDVGSDFLGVTSEAEFEEAKSIEEALRKASGPLMSWPQKLPDGTHLSRPELNILLQKATSLEGTTTALLGAPGSGKTALLAALGDRLREEEISFLAIKADTLDTSVTTEADLQRALGLPDLPSSILIRLSHVRPVVLIVDQLDALASYLDLRTERLSVLLNLVRALGRRRNVNVILSARAFEYEHDVRLRSVQAESVFLNLPPWSKVLEVLRAHGVTADSWPADAQEMLRTPQHLAMFLNLKPTSETQPFSKYQAMLEELWNARLLKGPTGPKATKLAGLLAEEMAEKESLWVARAKLDDHADELQTLLAAGVLTLSDTKKSVGFSHQTVFEFALARAFAEKEGRLSSYILGREASLFVRPKLWSSLAYLRDADSSTYQQEISAIWKSDSLREHLRNLLIEFVGQQEEPFSAEEELLRQALGRETRMVALQAMVGSGGWFDYFRTSELPKAMKIAEFRGVSGAILARIASKRSEGVMQLIQQNWLPDSATDGNTWFVLQQLPIWDDASLRIAETILGRTEISPFAFEHVVSTVGATQPEIAIKLAGIKLNVGLSKAKAEAARRAALPRPTDEEAAALSYYERSPSKALTQLVEGQHEWDSLEALAKSDPTLYLAHLWPWFTELVSAIRLYHTEFHPDRTFPVSLVLDFRFDGEGDLNLSEPPVLGGFRIALEKLATRSGSDFLDWLKEHENEEFEPHQRLFAHALGFIPERYATRALQFFTEDLRRLHLGSIEDYSGTTKRVVHAVSPYWNDAELKEFVRAVLNYAPTPGEYLDAKGRQFFYRDTDRLRFQLLLELPQDRLESGVVKQIAEMNLRFGTEYRRGTRFYGPTYVDSPMSSEAMTKASNAEIVNAFTKLPDSTNWDNPKGWGRGGNIQLSRSFADFAKTQPERAIQILDLLTPEIGSRAAGYALDAIAEFSEPGIVIEAIKRLEPRAFKGEEYRVSLGRAIDRLLRRNVEIDDEMLEMLISWLSDAGEAVAEGNADDDGSEDGKLSTLVSQRETKKDDPGSIIWSYRGFSTIPHGNFPALEAITNILLRRKDSDRLIEVLSDHLDRPEDERVWRVLIRYLRYLRPTNQARLDQFLEKLVEKYPGLMETTDGVVCLAYLQWNAPAFVERILSVWMSKSEKQTQQALGELATLIWLTQPGLEWAKPMVRTIVEKGSAEAVAGCTYAAINCWAEDDKYMHTAAPLLTEIIRKGQAESWSAVVDIFRLMDNITPEEPWIDLLTAITEQLPKQAPIPSSFVVDRLQTLLPHEAELVAKLALALTAQWEDELGDIRTGTAGDAPELVNLAITLHRLGPSTRDLGTTLFERLLKANAYSARDTLEQIDNRLPNRSIPARPRLPRRVRRARRKQSA